MSMWRSLSPGEIDLAVPGKQCVQVRLGREAELMLPIVIVHNGYGPTILVAGGTHGDEFEGQITVANFCRGIEPENVHGTLVLLPLHNVLACKAGTRLTPGDGSDLNRLYGRPGGDGPAHAIARFVETVLLADVDWVIDLHSGGSAHEFVLSSNLQARLNSAEFETMRDPLLAFDAPYAIVFDEVSAAGDMPHTGTLEGHARALGKKAISSELGGAGRVTPASLGVAEHGLRSLLSHIGVVPWAGATRPDQSRSQLLFLGRPEHYVRNSLAGRFAPTVALGDKVRKGMHLGSIAPLDDPLAPPEPIISPTDGIAVAIARHGLQQAGAGVIYLADTQDRVVRRKEPATKDGRS
ncbi:succinylglutamate desuccinylase/aspartoacylase domain-containing protein [Taklimakanibacter deserti]|uniref:succinylglutamate desuccinylase/aspartoacylase domain-containing protein n=1 Tax=Taklimakanibacter deserti TaxID=2267839 RepID=UPI000E64ECAA